MVVCLSVLGHLSAHCCSVLSSG